ncbi:MAG: serine/threonine-protein kinase [Candidatus Obscuribacterales bacterium]|nr:serine/threonine-protein kinase [Candidatus Obscuribacterales bacterium]
MAAKVRLICKYWSLLGIFGLMTESNEFGNFGQSGPANDPLQKDRQFASGQILIGKYEVMSLIGVGGMGKVYKVRQVFLNKALALKVLDLQQTMSELQMRRFQLEAKAAFSLSHPNLVKVFDFGLLETEDPYLVMDFVDGITLHDHLKREGPLTPEQCVKVFIQAASGLAYAHQRSVVHRDIKPSNIMLDAGSKIGANNSVKIVDFGIAKLSESGELQGLTRTGEIFGSPLYMSPEQCSGESVDHRSDIYSLGCTLFEALTGTPPHVGNSALRTMMLHQTSPAPLLREASLGVTFPDNLEQIVHRMLEKSPAERYQNFDEVVEDLNKALGQVAIISRPVAPTDSLRVETAGIISMKRVNFALMIVSVMALTSVLTLATDRFVHSRMLKHKVEAKPLTAQEKKAKADAILVHETAPLIPEAEKKNSQDSNITLQAFEKAPPIKPIFLKDDNLDREKLTFPEVPIGIITNGSSFRPLTVDDDKPWGALAKDIVQFAPTKILQLQLGGNAFPQGLKYPSVLKKIDPTLFQELHIERAEVEAALDKSFEYKKQGEQVTKVLKIVSDWKELEGFYVKELNMSKESIRGLSNLKKLQYLNILRCDTDADALAQEPFLRRLKFLALTKIQCDKIIDSICDSPKLESLSLSETWVSADSLKKLRRAPRLTFLDIQTANLGPLQMEAITKLPKLDRLSIRDSRLNPDQLKYLLANCPALKHLQLNGAAAEHVRSKLVEDTRIEILP